ncbi:MAG: MFS transporter [Frankia sp.]|nr:MFS transporter [Frankia sp.]
MTNGSTATAVAPARRLWPALAVLTAATLWTVTVEMLPSGLLPEISRGLHVDEGMVGVLVSAWAVTIALASIPLVRATLWAPRARLLTASLAVTAVTNLVTAFAPNFALALTGRMLTATAHGLFWAVVVSYLPTIVEPARLGRALSIVMSGPALAGLAGLPVASYLAGLVGWRAVFVGLSVILAVVAVGLWLVLPRPTEANGATAASGGERTGRWDRSAIGVVGFSLACALVLVGHFAAFTYITELTTRLGGMDEAAIPAILLVSGVLGGVGIAVSGFASDRFPRAAVAVTSALIAAGLAIVGLGKGSPAVFVTGTGIGGFAIGALPPIGQAWIMRASSPTFAPLAGSIVVVVFNVGIAAGAALGSLTLDYGPGWLVTAAAVAAAGGALLLALLQPRLAGVDVSAAGAAFRDEATRAKTSAKVVAAAPAPARPATCGSGSAAG